MSDAQSAIQQILGFFAYAARSPLLTMLGPRGTVDLQVFFHKPATLARISQPPNSNNHLIRISYDSILATWASGGAGAVSYY
jgi:hypothetical protein